MRCLSAAAAALLALCACGLPLKPPRLEPHITVSPQDAWARVLARRVDAQGRVDFEGLRKEPENLNNFVSWLGTMSPDTDPVRFPTAASRLAYYLNAYDAMALFVVIDSDVRPEDSKRFYSRAKLMIGGSLMTLSDVEAEALALKDVRAVFALAGQAKGHPRLPAAPYSAESLQTQLDGAARAFLSDARNVQVDPKRHVARLSQYLQRHRKELASRAASLLAYVNRYRDEKVPEAYTLEFAPFDWALNAQKQEKGAAGKPVASPGSNLP